MRQTAGNFAWRAGAASFQENGLDVAFEMIYADQRFVVGQREGFAVGDADEQRADQAGAAGDGDGVDILERSLACERASRTTGTIWRSVRGRRVRERRRRISVDVNLRGDDGGEDFAAVDDDGGGGFVAGGFDAEDARGHELKLG